MCIRVDSLAERQQEILSRLERLDGACSNIQGLENLKERQKRLLEHIAALEMQHDHSSAIGLFLDNKLAPSEVQARLRSVLVQDGVKTFRFVRAPSDYYSQVSTMTAIKCIHVCIINCS
jgi:hypothetical protein